MKNIILIAPPAAGKGTQSALISEMYHLPHISTGDLLRNEVKSQSELGKSLRQTMENGQLVSDDVVLKLLENRITQGDCIGGYILDGFPRNMVQAIQYEQLLNKLNYPRGIVIYLNIDEDMARKRITGRLSCTNCGTVYNDQFEDSKPKNFGTCDKCNSALFKRIDDNEKTFNERFNIYREQTTPLLSYYSNLGMLYTVGSGISKERTFSEIRKILERGII